MSKQSPKSDDQLDTTAEVSPPAPADEPEPLDEQEVTALAHRRWVERGCPLGSPEEDWFAAEREIRSRRHSS